VVAAHRAGLRRIIMPRKNDKDLSEIPTNILVSISLDIFLPFFIYISLVFSNQNYTLLQKQNIMIPHSIFNISLRIASFLSFNNILKKKTTQQLLNIELLRLSR
jgi:hypothetical protein